jgi:FkbM family methyltransferase
MLFATTVGPTGHVLAVEASSHNAEVARRNRDLNHVENLEILHAAVTETGGTVNFGRGLNGQVGDFEDSETVEAFTIDQLAQRHGDPDLVFLDIEGCEVRALHGAAQTLAKRPMCFVEVHVGEGLEDFGDSPDALLDFFPADQYDRYLSTETQRHPVPFDLDTYAQVRDARFFLTAVPKAAALV